MTPDQLFQETERKLTTLLGNLPGLVYRCRNDRDWTLEFLSEGCLALTGYAPSELLRNDPITYGNDIIHPEDQNKVWEGVQAALKENRPFQLVYRIITKDKRQKWVWVQGSGVHAPDGTLEALEGFITDITLRKQAEDLLSVEKEILEKIASGDPVDRILEAMARAVENQRSEMICSILLLDPDGIHLRLGTAPGLPESFIQAVDGLAIGPRVGSCGTAVYRKTLVIVEDIAADLLWADFRSLALEHGLKACWSQPIFSPAGEIYGTFAIYQRAPGKPGPADLHLLERMVHLAGIALERHRISERLRWSNMVIDHSTTVIFRLRAEEGWPVEFISKNVAQFGYSREDFLSGRISYVSLIHPDDLRWVAREAENYAERCLDRFFQDYRLVTRTGETRWVRDECIAERDESGRITHYQGVLFDITERKTAEEAVREAETRLRLVSRATNDAIWDWNLITDRRNWNEGVQTLFGYSPEDVSADHLWWVEKIHPEDRERVVTGIQSAIQGEEEVWTDDYRFRCRNGDESVVIDRGYIIRNPDGLPVRMVGSMMDITARKRHEETIRRMAYYDHLTGLPNRTLLRDFLQDAIQSARRESAPLALLLVDLDRFKEINDTLGHRGGDLLLQQIGPRLHGALRESDKVARLGGDEFAVVLPLAEAAHATLVAQKIQKVMEPPFLIEGLPIAVEATIGIALFPDHGGNPEMLMQHADVAMNQAQESGEGFAVYNPGRNRQSPRRLALVGELRQALESDRLSLYYQPKIALPTGRIFGVEGLVRWKHPTYGFIPPDEFIVLAEQSGLIKALTLWVFKTAFEQHRSWKQKGLDLSISVNLSARNLHDPHFPDQIVECLGPSRLDSTPMELEITEGMIIADPNRALETMGRLTDMGIRFAIDDFGIGYSSLDYLTRLPAETIKIDRSFVTHLSRGRNAVIVRSTIELAHNLGLKVVAEGVETRDAWDQLKAWACDAAQGYYMCKPIPPDELARWVAESPWGLGPRRPA